ncbi:ubiquinone/menaquinone biosynthesis C-methylase UbiE [Thermomonospora umbrina]|uniref:Ubiquinone/menaquinone biosynthesis C-methylase UbiE n=2 Tax=Thermomonospora umbrina TaxID=111806 RepID=A0A3D9SHY1_9ACTN|nr:ubiquinone/menaquinone biosynthesis C-methylase UbiE [Thermomonospora umbrina]
MTAAIAGIFDRSAATYERTGAEFFAPMGRELVRLAAPRPGERVLDVGCGRGHCLFPAAEAVGPDGVVVGVDLAPSMVAATAEEARRRGLDRVTVREGDAAAPPVDPGSFDLLLGGFVIFFLPDPASGVRAWARALRPGGRLTLSTFQRQDPGYEQMLKAINAFVPGEGGREPRRPTQQFRTEEPLTEVLSENGFVEIVHRVARFETRFADADHLWEWNLSHGGRGLVERVPEDRAGEVRAAAAEAAEAMRNADGDLVLRTEARYTTAVRP